MTTRILILVFALLPCVADAQEPRVYQPVGAPVDPKVPAQWNRYHDYAAATELLQGLAAAHPDRCKLQSLGKSFGGREMWVMTITNPDTGDDRSKPAMWIDGGIHANEIQGTEVVLYAAWFLLEMDGRSERIKQLLRERTFYLLPMLSPDSRDAHMHEPNSTHTPRSGLRPVDDDRDGLTDEDKPDDIDGDGHITLMRIADPHGKLRPHDDFPDVLVPVDVEREARPGEVRYTILGQEGIDNDHDGKVNEDGDGFYDPNRDWPWQWQPEYVQGGAHHYPLSIPENRMGGDFILDHPNIAAAQSFHNAGGMILRGPGTAGDKYDPADLVVFDKIGKTGERLLPGYRYLELVTGLYPAHGGEIDWLYAMRGTIAYTNELWTAFNFFRKEAPGNESYFGTENVQREFEKHLLLGEGVVKWHAVDHPTYGKVEVGGMKKSWMRQPPSFLLEEECHRNMSFCLYHADAMPLVKVRSVTVKDLGGGVREVTAVIENTKLIPTRLNIDVSRKITPPDRVTITGEGVQVLAGLIGSEPYFLNPREQKLKPAELRLDTLPGHSVVYCRWIVRGEGAVTVSVESVKGGRDTKGGQD